MDLNAQYQFTPRLGLSAVLRNAFNKGYLNSIGLFETAYRGEPRSLLLTLRYSFE